MELPDGEWAGIVRRCVRHINAWRVPPNWGITDWRAEMRAVAHSAAWEAMRDYDASKGISISGFVTQRVLARALTTFRREWAYALHCVPESGSDPAGVAAPVSRVSELVRVALMRLPEADRWLLQELYWKGSTESEIARQLSISQPAVNKRKRLIFTQMYPYLKP